MRAVADYDIYFNKPSFEGREREYMAAALDAGHISGNGGFTRRAEAGLAELLAAPKVLLTTSCTDALELAALLLDIQPGDEVVMPSFTFVSTANAFALRGARPVFADIREDTLNLDETLLADLVTERTRAVVPVHYAGVGCEMDAIAEVAEGAGAAVVEDNAHGLFGRYRGRLLGTFGRLATQSFHETKNITCGEGGALVINDEALIERAEILREKGTDRARFLRGQVDKYTWTDLGSSFLPSDLLAAVLCAQLEERESIQARREAIWNHYRESLAGWAGEHGVRLPVVPEHVDQAYHLFYLLLPTDAARDRLIEHLKQRRILAVFHYVPLHLSRMGERFGGRPGDCPVSESASTRLLRLPFYNQLTRADQDRVIEAVTDFTAF
jgi:dTDP-4-amino-4,6-dideoxygalactose transaminase